MHEVRNIGISVDRPWRTVYQFASRPENLHLWASGLGTSLENIAGKWFIQGPEGRAEVRFSAPNSHGILDHHVVLPDGREIYVPLRVIANGEGSEVVFTLFRLPEMTDERFAGDAEWVERDLRTLKSLLEAAG
jgi:hypothetical protein